MTSPYGGSAAGCGFRPFGRFAEWGHCGVTLDRQAGQETRRKLTREQTPDRAIPGEQGRIVLRSALRKPNCQVPREFEACRERLPASWWGSFQL
jgi:hypothetical protein